MARPTHLTAALVGVLDRPWGENREHDLHVDQVLLDEEHATIALPGVRARSAARRPLLVAVPSREVSDPVAQRDLDRLWSSTLSVGTRVARPGVAPAVALHLRALARPGEVVVSPLAAVAGAGAFGMLALRASALECGAWAAGYSVPWTCPRVVGVELEGQLAPGVGGVALARAILAAAQEAASGAILECHGSGVANISLLARIACARALTRWGAAAVVFPADEAVRAALRACGREADWRRCEGGAAGFDDRLHMPLGAISAERLERGTLLRMGPLAEDDHLRICAHALERSQVRDGRLDIVLGGRIQREVLAADGTLAVLERGGARLLEWHEATQAAPAAVVEGGFADGSPTDLEALLAAHLGLDTAAEAAARCAGARCERGSPLPQQEWLGRPGHDVQESSAWIARGSYSGRERAVVVGRIETETSSAALLPPGPRTHVVRHVPDALAEQVLRIQDPGVAPRALAHGGGVVAAGAPLGGEGDDETASRALAALGVGAVIAAGFRGSLARQLALHGVLPLVWERSVPDELPAAGSEVEWVAERPTLVSGGVVAVRDLTRGLTLGARAAAPPTLMALACGGGLPALMCAPLPPTASRIPT